MSDAVLCPRCHKAACSTAVELSFRSGTDDCGSGVAINFRTCTACASELQGSGLAILGMYERILAGLSPVDASQQQPQNGAAPEASTSP